MTPALRLAALAAAALPPPDARDWRRQMERAIAQGHTAAYLAGVGERLGVKPGSALLNQRNLSRAERAEIASAVAKQLQYLDAFDPAQMSAAQTAARAELYALAVQATYHQARWGDWELPWVPCDGSSECLSRCRCSASVKDNGDGTGTYVWVLGSGESERHCPTCPSRAGEHPVRRKHAR